MDDHTATPGFDHAPGDGLSEQIRSDQIDIEHMSQLARFDLIKCAGLSGDSGRAHRNIDGAGELLRSLDQMLHLPFVAGIAGNEPSLMSAVAQRLCVRFPDIALKIRQHHPGAVAGIASGDRETDATGRTGDDCRSAFHCRRHRHRRRGQADRLSATGVGRAPVRRYDFCGFRWCRRRSSCRLTGGIQARPGPARPGRRTANPVPPDSSDRRRHAGRTRC